MSAGITTVLVDVDCSKLRSALGEALRNATSIVFALETIMTGTFAAMAARVCEINSEICTAKRSCQSGFRKGSVIYLGVNFYIRALRGEVLGLFRLQLGFENVDKLSG